MQPSIFLHYDKENPPFVLGNIEPGDSFYRWLNGEFKSFMSFTDRPWMVINLGVNLLEPQRFPPDVRARIREGCLVFFYDLVFVDNGSSYELEKVHEFFSKPPQIYLCERHSALGPFEKLGHFDIFQIHCRTTFHHHICEPDRAQTKKVLCGMYRYEAFRQAVVAFILNSDREGKSLVSCYHRYEEPGFSESLGFPLEQIEQSQRIRDGLEKLNARVPISLAVDSPAVLGPEVSTPSKQGENQRHADQFFSEIQRAYVSIVCETEFCTSAFSLSEKTLQPVLARRPFILVGAAGSLNYFKNLGFRSFAPFLDESYDEIVDPALRMSAVLREIDRILKMPFEQLEEMRLGLSETLNFNHNHFSNHFIEERQKALADMVSKNT